MDTKKASRTGFLGLLLLAVPLVSITACGGDDSEAAPRPGGAGGDDVVSSSSSGDTRGGGAMVGSGGTTGSGGMGPGPDTTPPSVVSVVPADGAQGVTDDATIIVTFSEPMDKTSAQAAVQSSDLGSLIFNWLDDQTMEVVPAALSYAQGGPSVAATDYGYSVTNVAEDLAGNPLPTNFDASFATLREITDFMPETFEGAVSADGSLWELNDGVIPVGRVTHGEFNQFHANTRLLVDFDISGIPAGADLLLADIDCDYVSIVGGKPLTTDAFSHISYDPADRAAGHSSLSLQVYADPLGFALPFFPSPHPRLTEDVTGPLQAQRQASASLLQFRLSVPSNARGTAANYLIWRNVQNPNAGCGPEALRVVYRMP